MKQEKYVERDYFFIKTLFLYARCRKALVNVKM